MSEVTNQKHLHPKIWVPVLIILALAAGYLAYANTNSLWPFGEQNQVNKPDQTAGWKTYSNQQFGYEFKYPIGWSIDYEVDYSRLDLTASDIDTELIFKDGSENPDSITMSRAYFYDTSSLHSLDQSISFIKERISNIQREIPVGGGIAFYKVTRMDGVNQGEPYPEANIASNDNVYAMRYFTSKNTPIEKQEEIILQILSTFKFTDTATTYRSQQECEATTKKSCTFQSCDVQPCGSDSTGWVPMPASGSDKACTQDAKQCPDGSYVSRTGPNCEFAACPASPAPKGGEGQFCGGIAGVSCPAGYSCKLDGKYPDAGGTCVVR